MKLANVAKILAICSSVTLAGCFVAYRQNHAKDTGEPPMMPGSKNPSRMTVFPSSKNMDAVLSPAGRGKPTGREGSDFVSPLNGTSVDGIPADPPKKSEEQHLLPGSKSIGMPVFRRRRDPDVPVTRDTVDGISNDQRPQEKKPDSQDKP